jgi:hypothetical protein
MRTSTRFRPQVEGYEERCLLAANPLVHQAVITVASVTTLGVVEISNPTNATVAYQFRWLATDAWSSKTLGPGQRWYYWAPTSYPLAPQIQFDWSFAPGWQNKLYSLAYNVYQGGGTPPESAAKVYAFQVVNGGGALDLVPGNPGNPVTIPGLPLKSSYQGGFQDYVFNWNQGRWGWWTDKAFLTIDPNSVRNTATGVTMSGSITLYGWGGISLTLPFAGTYHDFGGGDRVLDIQQAPGAPQGYYFGIHFYVTPQGGLTTKDASGNSNILIEGSNLYDDNTANTNMTYIVLS